MWGSILGKKRNWTNWCWIGRTSCLCASDHAFMMSVSLFDHLCLHDVSVCMSAFGRVGRASCLCVSDHVFMMCLCTCLIICVFMTSLCVRA